MTVEPASCHAAPRIVDKSHDDSVVLLLRAGPPARTRRGAVRVQFSYLLIASGLTGVKKLTRLPSGSRNSSERFPHGWVVGSWTNPLCSQFIVVRVEVARRYVPQLTA
jgi:hypothetical protein